jgi:phospholipid/cholesterol/gamma-HCH transport system substrate-binding protein
MADGTRQATIKVGILVLSALVILIMGSLWIAGSTVFGVQRVPYQVLMQESAGISTGDRVRYAGVSVGRIQGVTLQPEDDWPVVFDVALRPNVPVREDSTARIATEGLLGSAFLEIGAGSPGAARLPPGSAIRGEASVGLEQALGQVDELSNRVTALLDQAATLLEKFSENADPILHGAGALLSEENAENFAQLLASLREVTEEAGPRLPALLDRLETLTDQLGQGVDRVPELSEKVSALVDDLRAALGPDGARLAGVLEAAEGGMISADEALTILTRNRAEIETALHDLQETTANLKAFSQQIKEQPSSLVRRSNEPDRRPGQDIGNKNR